jgi:hypothetical protein
MADTHLKVQQYANNLIRFNLLWLDHGSDECRKKKSETTSSNAANSFNWKRRSIWPEGISRYEKAAAKFGKIKKPGCSGNGRFFIRKHFAWRRTQTRPHTFCNAILSREMVT